MTSFWAGALVAAAVAGPPLGLQVRSGSIDATSAVERGALVALACAARAAGVLRKIVHGYQLQVRCGERQPPPEHGDRFGRFRTVSARAPGRSTR